MQLTIQAFSLKSIPKRVIDSIPSYLKRGKTLAAYVIGQEGESNPVSLQKDGSVRLSWSERAIRAMSNLAKGAKLFLGHQKGTNSNVGRKSVTEAIASYIDTIDGKLSAIIVAPFDGAPSEDVCSIEADIVTREQSDGFIVEAINKLTGIAIGKGSEEAPAFEGARQIATVQCFTPQETQISHRSAHMEITFQDVHDFVKEKQVWPSQLFHITDIMKDRKYIPVLKTEFMDHGEIKELKDELKEANQKLSVYQGREGRDNGRKELEKMLSESTTDGQKEHILRAWDKGSQTDFSDRALEKFIRDETKEYDYLIEKYGSPKNPDDGKSPDQLEKERKDAELAETDELEDVLEAALSS